LACAGIAGAKAGNEGSTPGWRIYAHLLDGREVDELTGCKALGYKVTLHPAA